MIKANEDQVKKGLVALIRFYITVKIFYELNPIGFDSLDCPAKLMSSCRLRFLIDAKSFKTTVS